MKTLHRAFAGASMSIAATWILATPGWAQSQPQTIQSQTVQSQSIQSQSTDEGVDRVTVPFSDPSRPGLVKASILNGSIFVTGYDGKEVLVEARVREDEGEGGDAEERRLEREAERREREAERRHEGRSESHSTEGMHRIPNTSTGLTAEEDNNVLEIAVDAIQNTVDLHIKVPSRTSLELSTVNDGDLQVERVDGEIDVNNVNGEVTLKDVSGSVVAHALNGNVVVAFDRVDPKKSMSFSSMNGDIDVTLPADVRASVRFKSDNGEIYSDFDIKMDRRGSPQVEDLDGKKAGKRGKFRVGIDDTGSGTLNGGGPELRFETFNGNIYIRKQ